MSPETKVLSLLEHWEEGRLQGRELTTEVLCADCPELAGEMHRLIDKLKRVAPLLSSTTTLPAAPLATAAVPQVPGYVVLGELSRGGMGVVYHAHDKNLNRPVALKMILAGASAGADERRRFRTEAEAVARLQHPGIVQIYDIGEHDASPYLSLEFCAGGSLAARLNGQPLAPAPAAHLLEHLALAVQAAHQQGVLHRDLKPANVLLTSGKRLTAEADEAGAATPPLAGVVAKITDFGLAKLLNDSAGSTLSGEILGTPSYMAPEQSQGQNTSVGPEADVYALGAILYELLTGRPPFRGATVLETLEQVRSLEPVVPRRLQPKVSRDLETICLKCLQKQPGKRYATAQALADDLRRFLTGQPIQARPVGPLERSGRWCRRNPLAASLIAAVALVLLGGTAVASFFAFQASEQAQIAQEQTAKAQENLLSAHRNLYVADMNRAQRAWEDNEMLPVRELLDRQKPEHTGGIDLRAFEWYYLWRQGRAEVLRINGHAVLSVAFSPDSERLASSGIDKTVKISNARTGQEILTLKGHTGEVNNVVYSPDGERLASTSWHVLNRDKPCDVRVWNARNGHELFTLTGHTGRVSQVAWSPDGKRLASAGVDSTVKIWDARTGEEVATIPAHKGIADSVAFSRDGLLASAGQDGTIKIWDISGRRLLLTLRHEAWVCGVAFSPDAQRLASAGMDKTVKIWDARTGAELHTLTGHTGVVKAVAFTPDGRRLATGSLDKTLRLWEVATGKSLVTLKAHAKVSGLAFSPNGQRLASGQYDGTVRIWDAHASPESLTLAGHSGRITHVAFGSDGHLASASQDGTAKVWNIRTGQYALTLKGHADGVTSVVFSPDGQRLATASTDKTVKVWEARTGQEISTFKGHTDAIRGVAFSGDGRCLASASADKTVKVWEAATGRELLTFRGHDKPVSSVVFSPDDRSLASASADQTVRVWDATSGQVGFTLRARVESSFNAVVFSPNGLHLVSAEMNEMRVWDAGTGKEVQSLRVPNQGVLQMAFSADGRRLASANSTKYFATDKPDAVSIWDTSTWQQLLTFKALPREITSVALSGDGRHLAAGKEDGTLEVWNVQD